MQWFRELTGFDESPEAVRANLELDGTELVSAANGRRIGVGTLTTPSLTELRSAAPDTGPGELGHVVGDARALHADPANAGAIFQVASQFNLLEMVGPSRTPEEGVAIYAHDLTQGPACAMACAGGTIHRNWFAPVGDQVGQTSERQIDCLADLGAALGNGRNLANGQPGELWTMQNGYCLPTESGLRRIWAVLDAASTGEREHFGGLLQVGFHADVEVTEADAGHTVTQVYASALPVSSMYSPHRASLWEPFARLVLESSYEALLRIAHLRRGADGSDPVIYLTRIGGGAFGNEPAWIDDAIRRAIELTGAGLDLRMVTHG